MPVSASPGIGERRCCRCDFYFGDEDVFRCPGCRVLIGAGPAAEPTPGVAIASGILTIGMSILQGWFGVLLLGAASRAAEVATGVMTMIGLVGVVFGLVGVVCGAMTIKRSAGAATVSAVLFGLFALLQLADVSRGEAGPAGPFGLMLVGLTCALAIVARGALTREQLRREQARR